jgi:hypothetical protein
MKHISLTKILPFIALAVIIFAPLKASADANFNCSNVATNVSGTNYGVTLTVDQLGTIPLSAISSTNGMYVISQTDSNSVIRLESWSQGTSAKEGIYLFDNLTPNTSYKAYANYTPYAGANGLKQNLEQMSACSFTTPAAPPTPAPSASNFSCSNTDQYYSPTGSYGATETVDQLSTINFTQVNLNLVSTASASAPSAIVTPQSSSQGSSPKELLSVYSNLAPATTYNLVAFDSASGKTVETVSNCQFTTSGIASATSTPASTAATQPAAAASSSNPGTTTSNNPTTSTNPACSPTNITDDGCYEQNCTGQASEDSSSCTTYATAYAIKDDNGDTSCASINSENETTCCDNDIDSPMCIAYNDYSAQEAQAQQGTATAATAQPGINKIGAGIVSPDGDGLVPCDGNDCTVNSVIQLLDNLMNFFFQTLLLPIFVVMVMYLGVSYLTAEGKPGQHAKVLSMAKHMVLGLVLMLCAWLIVHTILSILGYTDTLGFFGAS